jgi:hypothetical protein
MIYVQLVYSHPNTASLFPTFQIGEFVCDLMYTYAVFSCNEYVIF